jgi:hypothetical protein
MNILNVLIILIGLAALGCGIAALVTSGNRHKSPGTPHPVLLSCNEVGAVKGTCGCGHATCQKGEFCFAKDNVCVDICPDAMTNVDCACGNTMCKIGQYCDAGKCTSPATCEVDKTTTSDCLCSGHVCKAGGFCSATGACADAMCSPDTTVRQTKLCVCGNKGVCHSGEYCDPSREDACMLSPPCVSKDGSGAASGACVCGDTVCEKGWYCHADKSVCTEAPACNATSVTTKVTKACSCGGNEECNPGMYCDPIKGRCS